MPRPLRIEYEGARYHVMSRGDRREAIFLDDADRTEFVRTLGETCAKTGWQVHAYCLMSNHFHLIVETPRPNLSLGMKWLLGTYTQRFNRRHRHWGHLFGGRYKAQMIDERGQDYLRRGCDYVHLNPVRAGMIAKDQKLESFCWSSYPAYPEDERLLRNGWKIGADDFRDWLAEKLSRRGRKGEQARERSETDEALAEQVVLDALREMRWRESDLAIERKGHRLKVKIAQRLRWETAMSRQWIADRLKMGSASYVSNLLNSVDS